MSKSVTKFLVAVLMFTSFIGGVASVYAAEERAVYPETETVTRTNTKTNQGCSLKLTATATYNYANENVSAGSYYLTPTCVGTTYQFVSSGWNSNRGKTITCSGKGLFIPNSSANGFYLRPSVTFEY